MKQINQVLIVYLGIPVFCPRHQVIVIEYLQAENSMLQERLRGRRLRFSDAERALLARKAKAVGRRALLELRTMVTPVRSCAGTVSSSPRSGISRTGVGRDVQRS
ncbi:MAG: hypothetical protein WKH97_01840 [Casimicrobiaceae bacterium]